jgi:hypothetical protein
MIHVNQEIIRTMIQAADKAQKGIEGGAAMVLRGLEQHQKDFEVKKRDIENDIKRGSRLSKGSIPC